MTAGRARTLRRRLLAPVAMMSFALVAAGCGGTSSSDDPTGAATRTVSTGPPQTSAPPPDAASSAPATEPASPDTANTTAPGTGSDSARCTAEGLTMSVGRADPGAGQVYYRLTFVNKSAHSCTLNGFPGVSLIKRDGSVIGVPAKHEGAARGRTVIAPGKAANATLHTLNQGVKGSGCWDRADYLRVYPPGSKEALTLRDPQLRICGDRFTTTSVEG